MAIPLLEYTPEQARLEVLATLIEKVLADNDAKARVTGGATYDNDWVALYVKPALSTRVFRIKQLEGVLYANLASQVRVTSDEGQVIIWVKKR